MMGRQAAPSSRPRPAVGRPRKSESRRLGRLFAFGLFASVWFAIVLLRLFDLQVRHARDFADRAQRQQEGLIEIRAVRGPILDRDGVELALSTPIESIGVFPQRVQNPDTAAEILAGVLDTPPKRIEAALRGDGFRWIRRLAEPGETKRVRDLGLRFLHFEKESKRYYPKGSLAAHVVGFVNIDHKGLGGLEASFDEQLTGLHGSRRVMFDGGQQRYETRIAQAPIPGAGVILTIDEGVQAAAEETLAAAIAETKSRAGAIVAVDPNSGDVLALANWPTFDPNRRPRRRKPYNEDYNYAISHVYEPGSTFKIVTAAAALEEGLTTPDEIIDCQNGAIYVGRRRIRDHKPFGLLPVSDVIANSSNVGVIKLGQRVGAARLEAYLKRFGFGAPTGIELPGERAGLLPDGRWRDGTVASVAMGQEIGVTPLQLAQAFAVIANGGYLVRPRLVSAVLEPSGLRRELERPPKTRVIEPGTAATLRAMLERTVREGTGRLADAPGYRVAGKTGTAQMIDPETRAYSPTDYIASFGGFAPVNDPALVAVVVLEAPVGKYYGGLVAAPTFAQLAPAALRFLDVPPSTRIRPEKRLRRDSVPVHLVADYAAPLPSDLVGDQEVVGADGTLLVAAIGAPDEGSDSKRKKASAEAEPVRLRVTDRVTPDLRGLTAREALQRTAESGLRFQARGAGVVVRQQPAPGAPLPNGATVRVDLGRLASGVALKL